MGHRRLRFPAVVRGGSRFRSQKIFDGVSLALLVGARPGARAWAEVTCGGQRRDLHRSGPKPSTLSPRMTFASG